MFDASARLGDETNQSLMQILLAVKGIPKFPRDGVPIESIDCDVTTLRIMLTIAKLNRLWVPAIGGFIILTKRRDLKRVPFFRDTHTPEHCRRRIEFRKHLCNVIRVSFCRDIDVFRKNSRMT